MALNQLGLIGKHNAYNSMAAGIVGHLMNLRKETIRDSMADFQALEHRLERVVKIQGVEFINDSKATNVNSTWFALESMSKPVVWIAGGVDKGNEYEVLSSMVQNKVKALICLGTNNMKIHQAFRNDVDLIFNTQSMWQAVRIAFRLAQEGDAVLLSPACASFDLFKNYEDRGRQFKAVAREL